MPRDIDQNLNALRNISGFIAAAVVDAQTGLLLGTIGGSENFDIEIIAAVNCNAVKAEIEAASALGLPDTIDDIVITTKSQYQVVRPTSRDPNIFIFLALNRAEANLVLARRDVGEFEKKLAA